MQAQSFCGVVSAFVFVPQAMKCLERGLETKEMVLETDDPWVGQSLHHLADLYVLLGNLE